MSGISSTRIANWINVNYGNKFDPFRVTIKPPLLGVVIDFEVPFKAWRDDFDNLKALLKGIGRKVEFYGREP